MAEVLGQAATSEPLEDQPLMVRPGGGDSSNSTPRPASSPGCGEGKTLGAEGRSGGPQVAGRAAREYELSDQVSNSLPKNSGTRGSQGCEQADPSPAAHTHRCEKALGNRKQPGRTKELSQQVPLEQAMERVRQRKEERLLQGQRERQGRLQGGQKQDVSQGPGQALDQKELVMFFRDALPTLRGPLAKVSFYLLHLLRSLPNGVGTGCRQQLRCFFGLATTEAELASTGDVFPLPSSLSVEDEALVSLAAQPGALERVPVKQ